MFVYIVCMYTRDVCIMCSFASGVKFCRGFFLYRGKNLKKRQKLDLWPVTCDLWPVMYGLWPVIHDPRPVTCDPAWPVTYVLDPPLLAVPRATLAFLLCPPNFLHASKILYMWPFMRKRALTAFRFRMEFRLEAVWKPFERNLHSFERPGSSIQKKFASVRTAWSPVR